MTCKKCILPLIHLETWQDGRVGPCCYADQTISFGDLNTSSLKEIWKSESLKSFRQKFNSDHLPAACKYCKEMEDLGIESPRQRENRNWNLRTDEHHELKSVAVRFSNRCNLSCRTCNPNFSSAWIEDAKRLAPERSFSPLRVKSLLSSLLEVGNELEHIYFAGGEPLLDSDHTEVLKWLAKNNNKIQLDYNTNLTNLPDSVLELWSEFTDIQLYISIDGAKARGEYIRKGLDWDKFISNLKRAEAVHSSLIIYPTISILNIFDLRSLYMSINESINAEFYKLSFLHYPECYSVQSLPLWLKERAKDYLDSFKELLIKDNNEYLADSIDDLMTFMFAEDKSKHYFEFVTLTKKLDAVRGESFFELFPEFTK